MKKIYVFDFDGTLTRKDSMMSVIIYHRGKMGLLWALLRQIHLILMMFMGKYSNHKTKEHLLDYCFGGLTNKELETLFTDFAEKYKGIIDNETYECLQNAQKEQDSRVLVITASPRMWVEKFFDPGDIRSGNITILGTELEFENDIFTGRFLSANCYGQEKVNRLLTEIPGINLHRDRYFITAYGDSRGDREMFAFADESILIKR